MGGGGGGGGNVPGIPGACAIRNFTYLVRGPLWRLACYSQNTVANVQQPIVTSRCLHVPWSRKRRCSVYRSPLNLIWQSWWHYKHVFVSAYLWRYKLEATLGWITSTGIIFIKRMMAPTPSMSVATVCTTNKSQWGKVFSADYRNLTLHFPSVSRRFKSWDTLCLNEFLE